VERIKQAYYLAFNCEYAALVQFDVMYNHSLRTLYLVTLGYLVFPVSCGGRSGWLEHRASVKRFVSLQFLNLTHSVGFLGRLIRQSQGRYLTQIQNKHTHPRVGFEPTIPAFERAKTVLVFDRAATVIGGGRSSSSGMHLQTFSTINILLMPCLYRWNSKTRKVEVSYSRPYKLKYT
jgi:hypothetical protein